MALLIGDIVKDVAVIRPHGIAATLLDEAITFGELDARANQLAHVLRGLGVRRGDVVAWWTGMSLDELVAVIAINRLGAIFTPVDPAVTGAEAERTFDDLVPRLTVVDSHRRHHMPRGHSLVMTGTKASNDLQMVAASAAQQPVGAIEALDESQPHILYPTSGSTGQPKGVLVSHRATWLRSSPGGGVFAHGVCGGSGVLSTFPLSHYGGWHFVFEAWLNRAAVHLVPRATISEMQAAIDKRKPSALYAIPSVWERLLDSGVDLSSLRQADIGTSSFDPELLARIHSRAPQSTSSVLYGTTETGRLTKLNHAEWTDRPGTVGRSAFPGVITLAPDGEILFRGPTLMSGYRDLPELTAEVMRDGWFHTGDLGRVDDDGYFWITGRKDDVVHTGGMTVAPAEVEAAVRRLPGIVDVAVIGVPDRHWGEIICAVVVLQPGVECPDVPSLRSKLVGLSSYKHPRRVVAVSAIPRTALTGQAMRRKLRQEIANQGAAGPLENPDPRAGHGRYGVRNTATWNTLARR